MMITPTRTRSVADHQAYYKKVASKVDCRWRAGTPISRREGLKTKIPRRKTESAIEFKHSPVLSNDKGEENDEVFDEPHLEDINDISSDVNEDFNTAAATSIETVSQHFRNLFEQLEVHMKTASIADCGVISKEMNDMKRNMATINRMFEDLLNAGDRLETFLDNNQE